MRPIVTEANHGTGSDLADSAQSPSYPKSTYDVLRSAQLIPLPEPRRTPLPFEAELVISEQSAQLLRIYQTGIGTWMDILDHSLTYQRQVVRCALSSGLLLYSICALSAKQMSLVGEQSLWEPVAARYYGESLTLLIQGLNQPQTSHGIVLTATIVLCSYELLANPGPDYKRHLYGAHTLIQTRGVVAQGTALERASFWVYARQDVALAIINESTTLISPQEWRAALPDLGAEEDAMGNKMLWLLARVIELRFTPTENMWPETRSQGFRDVSTELDQWWDDLPSLARGVPIGESTHDELNEVLFYVPSAAAGVLYYHMARILCLEYSVKSSVVNAAENSVNNQYHKSTLQDELRSHGQSIASICFSRGLPDGVLPVAVNPLFYAARYISSLPLKARIWAFLDNIEAKLGYYTRSRVTQLQRELQPELTTANE